MTKKIGSDSNQMFCNFCGNNNNTLKKCSTCKKVFYCGVSCQRKDWLNHKKVCKKPNNPTTKKTNKLSTKNLKTDKNPKINLNSDNWYNFCEKTPFYFLIHILENGKISTLMKELSQKNSLKLLMAYLGILLAKFQSRLFFKLEIKKNPSPEIKSHYEESYYDYLEKENYINIFTYNGPLSIEKTLEKGYALIGKKDKTMKTKYFVCKITKKGEQNLEKIQKIVLETILDLLEIYFSELIEINNTNFKTILEDETFDAIFKHRKPFLFDEIIFKLFKNKNKKNTKEFKRKIKEYKTKKITKEELKKILRSYDLI